MNEPDDELTPELRGLLRRGIAPLEAPDGAAERLTARLATTLAGAGALGAVAGTAGGSTLGWTRATAAKWLVVAALGGAVAGTGITLAALSSSQSRVPAPSASVVPPPAPAPAADAGVPAAPAVEPIEAGTNDAVPSTPPAPKAAPSVDAGRPDTAAKERELLDGARTAFGRGDLSDAYRTLEMHRTKYPTGVLAEEREALAVRTLSGLGRADEARARAIRFEATYPDSVMLPVVRATTSPRDAGRTDANL